MTWSGERDSQLVRNLPAAGCFWVEKLNSFDTKTRHLPEIAKKREEEKDSKREVQEIQSRYSQGNERIQPVQLFKI